MTDRLAAPQEGRIDLLTTDCALTSRANMKGGDVDVVVDRESRVLVDVVTVVLL